MICACYINRDSDERAALESVLEDLAPTVVPFSDLDDLKTLSCQTIIDVIYVPVNGDLNESLDLVYRARKLSALSVVPIVLKREDPTPEQIDDIFASPIDEFLDAPLTSPVASARLRLAISRSWRDLDVNPSSRLPGPAAIERVLEAKIQASEEFAICYADIDDFKAFNDYYGYFFGDHTIRTVARILRDEMSEHQPNAFIGHIGGDDFILLVDPRNVKPACEGILARFDHEIVTEYEPRDRRNGYIIAKNRRGVPETYPLMTLSIAVIINHGNRYRHVSEIARRIAELKKFTKTLAGSNYVVERDNAPQDRAVAQG